MIDRWYRNGLALAFAASIATVSACGETRASGTASATPASSSGGSTTSSTAPVAANGPHQTEVGEQPPDFTTQDPNRWVNGQPFTLASARGDVVLVESWHRL